MGVLPWVEMTTFFRDAFLKGTAPTPFPPFILTYIYPATDGGSDEDGREEMSEKDRVVCGHGSCSGVEQGDGEGKGRETTAVVDFEVPTVGAGEK